MDYITYLESTITDLENIIESLLTELKQKQSKKLEQCKKLSNRRYLKTKNQKELIKDLTEKNKRLTNLLNKTKER